MATDNERSFNNMSKLNMAHVLMLNKQQIISKQDAETLLDALLELRQAGKDSITLDPKYEDYYFNTERHIISKVGIDVGGRLHTARSRNDLHSTILRMNIRDSYLAILPRTIKLRELLLKLAAEERDTVLTGYTHMQPAQPMTLGFYFSSVAEALERDADRLTLAWTHLNYATLGGCASFGTSFPIDRDYTAKLLGFYGPIVNTIDAVGTRDYMLEIEAAFAVMMITINRFAHDIYYWCSNEFNYLEMDDSVCSTSSIMPQKKNPGILEYIKSKSAHQLAAFVDTFTCMRGVPWGHNRDTAGEAAHLIWDAFSEMEATLELLCEAIGTAKIKHEHLKERADQNYCTVTELADILVREEGYSFRLAHEIVGYAVMESVDAGKTTKGITAELLNDAAIKFAGRPLGWSQARVDSALDSYSSVINRQSLGSPCPAECDKMVATMKIRLAADQETFTRFASMVSDAYINLETEVQALLHS
jgi:argininosuccinate lyase